MKLLELHMFSFLFNKLRIYRQILNKLPFALQPRGTD